MTARTHAWTRGPLFIAALIAGIALSSAADAQAHRAECRDHHRARVKRVLVAPRATPARICRIAAGTPVIVVGDAGLHWRAAVRIGGPDLWVLATCGTPPAPRPTCRGPIRPRR